MAAWAWICETSAGGIVSPQSKASAVLLSTDSASVCVLELIFTLMSTWPAAIPGTGFQFGLRTTENDWLGTTFLIMYGPTPGGGLLVRLLIAVPVGTMPDEGKARTLGKAPYGATSLIVILPVASSVVIPEIVLAVPLSKALAPAMFVV